jgi:hypothetical protein
MRSFWVSPRLSHAAKELEDELHRVDPAGAHIDLSRVRAVRIRADEQAISARGQLVEDESAKAVGSRRRVGGGGRIARSYRQYRIMR